MKVGNAPHNLLVGTAVELGPFGLILLALFLGPLILRRGWGPEAATVQAALASLMVVALFLDILSNRKQVWLVIGLAAGLGYLARRRTNVERTSGAWLWWWRRSPEQPSTASATRIGIGRAPRPAGPRPPRVEADIQPAPNPRNTA